MKIWLSEKPSVGCYITTERHDLIKETEREREEVALTQNKIHSKI